MIIREAKSSHCLISSTKHQWPHPFLSNMAIPIHEDIGSLGDGNHNYPYVIKAVVWKLLLMAGWIMTVVSH